MKSKQNDELYELYDELYEEDDELYEEICMR